MKCSSLKDKYYHRGLAPARRYPYASGGYSGYEDFHCSLTAGKFLVRYLLSIHQEWILQDHLLKRAGRPHGRRFICFRRDLINIWTHHRCGLLQINEASFKIGRTPVPAPRTARGRPKILSLASSPSPFHRKDSATQPSDQLRSTQLSRAQFSRYAVGLLSFFQKICFSLIVPHK